MGAAGGTSWIVALVKQIEADSMPALPVLSTPYLYACNAAMHRPCTAILAIGPAPAKPWPGAYRAAHLYCRAMNAARRTARPAGPSATWSSISLYRLIAIALQPAVVRGHGPSAGIGSAMAVVASTLAIVWNVTFNHLFEEMGPPGVKGRSAMRRVVHASGLPGSLALALIHSSWPGGSA